MLANMANGPVPFYRTRDQQAPAIFGRRDATFLLDTVDEENRTIELSFSSDAEIEIYPGCIEILSHEDGACDLSRMEAGANALFNHDRDKPIGVVEKAWIASAAGGGRKGRALVRFGTSNFAEEIWKDVKSGVLRNTSVGYRVLKYKLFEEREGVDVYIVTLWQPTELSIVTVPADISTGVGRDDNNQEKNMNPRYAKLYTPRQFFEPDKGDNPQGGTSPKGTDAPPSPTKVNVVEERQQAATAERQRVSAILEACRRYEAPEIAERAISEGLDIHAVRESLLEHVEKRNANIVQGSKPIGMSEREVKSFSFVNLIRAITYPTERSFQEDAAAELRACEAAANQMTHRAAKGIMVPIDVLSAPISRGARADIISVMESAGYTGTGGATIETKLLASSFIDLLRNRCVFMSLCTQLSGLVGQIDIPKQTSGANAGWIGEDDEAPDTDVDFGLVQLRPKTVAAHAQITRKMLMQPAISVEALVRLDIARALAQAIDTAGFYADGLNDKPTGLLHTDGINTVPFADDNPTYKELVEMETRIASDNADVASMKYVANAIFRGYAKTELKFTGVAGTIWEPGNTVNGYGAEITNQVTTGDIFFGNWADMLIGMWGGLELASDPYTQSRRGRIRLTAFQDVDLAVRRPESFCYGVKDDEGEGGGDEGGGGTE